MLTQEHIREALMVCFDPELPVNIVDLGLVRNIRVAPDVDSPGFEPRYLVAIELTMRAPNEQREAMLVAQVQNRLAGMPEVSRSSVDVVWQPAWNADHMTPAARRQLGLDRGPKQGLVSITL